MFFFPWSQSLETDTKLTVMLINTNKTDVGTHYESRKCVTNAVQSEYIASVSLTFWFFGAPVSYMP